MEAENRSSLIKRAVLMYLFSMLFVGMLIFIPAGSVRFYNGWLFMASLFIPMLFALIWLIINDPGLLARRMNTREKEKPQKIYLFLSIIVCIATFILPGLDFRLNWSDVPLPVVIIATVTMLSGYLIFMVVMRQNSYASRVIEIQEDQKLIDTGLYSVVRHPMYSGGTILYLSAPLVLGSYYALIPAALIPVLLIVRIMNEEKVLRDGLKGYSDYLKKVRYRLIPLVWLMTIPVFIALPSFKNRQNQLPDDLLWEKAMKLSKSNIILDAHIDWPERLNYGSEDISVLTENGDFDYVRARKGGLDAAFSVVYVNSGYSPEEGRLMADSLLNRINYYCSQNPDKFASARTPEDVRQNFERGLLSLPVCLENGTPIGDDLKYLQYLKDKGIVYITLNHNRANHISDSNFDEERKWNGLSPFGLEVIKEMNRLGIMIDISHSTDSTVFQALRHSTAPIAATHSLCRYFTPGFERNLPDTLIRAIADRQGIIMVNFGSFFLDTVCLKNWTYLFFTWQDSTGISIESKEGSDFLKKYGKTHKLFSDSKQVVDHIDHIVSIAGIDHVGIGSDFDGIGNAKPVDLPDVSAYPTLIFELLRRGYKEKEIEKILSANFLRVWDEVITAAGR